MDVRDVGDYPSAQMRANNVHESEETRGSRSHEIGMRAYGGEIPDEAKPKFLYRRWSSMTIDQNSHSPDKGALVSIYTLIHRRSLTMHVSR